MNIKNKTPRFKKSGFFILYIALMIKNYTKYIKEAFESDYNIHDCKVGDKVRVNDELKYWAHKYDWDEGMLHAIGKEFVISFISSSKSTFFETYEVRLVDMDYWWPIQCLDPLEKVDDEPVRVRWYKKGKLEK
jgi:hypothetical protein